MVNSEGFVAIVFFIIACQYQILGCHGGGDGLVRRKKGVGEGARSLSENRTSSLVYRKSNGNNGGY